MKIIKTTEHPTYWGEFIYEMECSFCGHQCVVDTMDTSKWKRHKRTNSFFGHEYYDLEAICPQCGGGSEEIIQTTIKC